MCRSSAAVKLPASESEGRGFESRRQLFFFFFFFFFFFNILTSDKLEIFFDHSILVNAALIALTHGVYTVFLTALTMKPVYTPCVNAMSVAFTGTE